MHVRVLGAHQLETRDARLTSLLVDGVLAIDAGSLSSTLTLAEQDALQAILITHHHFDHVRDLLTLGLSTLARTTDVYSTAVVLDSLSANLLNGAIYPNFTETEGPGPPSLRLNRLEEDKPNVVQGYTVLPVAMPHGPPTFGYQVTDSHGKSIFYTSDTGAGCSSAWPRIGPHVLFIEVSLPDRLADSATTSGHLTPRLLEGELLAFRKVKQYLPAVRVIHINPRHEEEIRAELKEVARRLEADLVAAHEGLEVDL